MTDAIARGSKILLRGVPEADMEGIRARLEAHGVELVTSTNKAEILVFGTEAKEWQRKSAEKQVKAGVSILEIDAFLAALDLASSQSSAPLEEMPLQPAIEVGCDWVRILDVKVPRGAKPGRLTPSASAFVHFSLDGPTLRTARAVALAALHGVPCLLEGETATAKTSVILWVAHLTNAEVVRLNLNGQTDTSELVGRYVPAEGLPDVDADAFRAHLDLLEDESRLILERAHNEHRSLSRIEKQQIAANERLPMPRWRFQEGYIPIALRRGYWVIMDEINLAEAQVLERLNPVLERPASLVLTEGDGTRIGAQGDVPVHPAFRMFATMNPAEYAGRTAMSPAYRDRWQISRFVESPTEADLHAMLRRLVHGEQPEVPFEGTIYQGEAVDPIYPELRDVPEIDVLLQRLAVFHASVCSAAGMGGGTATIGRTRRERYVFSRRTLLTVLELMSRHILVLPGGVCLDIRSAPTRIVTDVLERLYLDRLQDGADREAVFNAMRAAGLGRNAG